MQHLDSISKTAEWTLFVSKAKHSISHKSKSLPWSVMLKKLKLTVLWRPTRPSRTNTPKKDILFIIGNWDAKVGSQELPGVTVKFGLGVQNEAGQRLTEFCQVNALVIANTLFQQHKRKLYTWTSPMINTEIRLIILFAAKDREVLYSQQKQDGELTVAQMSSIQFSRSVLSDSLWPQEPQHARPPCPWPTPGVHSNSCPLSQWCHPTVSSSVIPFSFSP